MKKVLSILLSICLLLAVVPCGILSVGASDYIVVDTEAVDPAPSFTATTTQTTAAVQGDSTQNLTWAEVKAKMPAKLNGSTLVFYNWNELSSITDAQKVVNDFTNDTGIKINYQVGNYHTYITEIAANQAAKRAPDIVRMKDLNPALMAMLQPLSNTGYDFSDAAWDQDVMDRYSYRGVAYATNMVNTVMQQPDVLLYNKKLISKYDLDDLDPYALWKKGQWNYDKFVEVCTAFKDEAGDDFIAFSPYKWQAFAQVQGSDFVLYTENGFKNNVTDPKLTDGIRKMIQMKEAGLVAGQAYQRQSFEAGKVLFFYDSIIGARKTHFYFTDLKTNGTLGIVPVPGITEQDYYQPFLELEAYAVPTGAKNAAAVPYFLRYWLDSKNYNVNQFFTNKIALDVYNHCMEQENRIMATNSAAVLTEGNGINQLPYELVNSTVGQVATILNSYRNQVESAVRQVNNTMDRNIPYVCEHSYDNDCDSTCNLCDAIRTVPNHIYDNACDTTCNVCDTVRTVPNHLYDNACDTTCNVCDEVRAVEPHKYYAVHFADDTTHWRECAVCGHKKDVGDHTYDDAYDADCNVCGVVREVAVRNGWVLEGDGWKYYKNNTAQTGWLLLNNTWYFLKDDGVMATGWLYLNNTWYYLNAGGAMQTGWQCIGGTWYYMNAGGAMTTGWQYIGGTYYYMNAGGAMTTGWQYIGGTYYYMNAGGAMTTGWQYIGGTYYYMNASGAMQTGWQYIGGTWYYMKASGAMTTGWQYIGGTWYYMNAGGAMQTGWQRIGGVWYYFYNSGAMATNCWIGGYWINAGGVWVA